MIRVQAEDFDPAFEQAQLLAALPAQARAEVGGVVSFVGLVRGSNAGDPLAAMTLEHYPGMTEHMLAAIEAEAARRWRLDASLIIHRHGRLLPGDRIVLVIAASRHREDAFSACQFLVDWLKTKAPFWKSEETPQGRSWVQARAADDEAAARWDKSKT